MEGNQFFFCIFEAFEFDNQTKALQYEKIVTKQSS